MSVIDIIFRVDSICKKYEKYDVEKRSANDSPGDAFARLYSSFESQIYATSEKAEMAAMETNRAKAVAMKAEVRRTKARLMDEIKKLQKLAKKRVKGLSQEELETRGDLVLMLSERIQAIPEGNTGAATKVGGRGTSSFNKHIKFDSVEGQFAEGFYEPTEEGTHFRSEYEMRKMKQDEGLDVISEGLDTLKNLARDMNEEMDRQVPLLDEIDTKVDKATTDIKNNNVRLRDNINKIRSSKNFCIDIILICILLGILAYLYNVLK